MTIFSPIVDVVSPFLPVEVHCFVVSHASFSANKLKCIMLSDNKLKCSISLTTPSCRLLESQKFFQVPKIVLLGSLLTSKHKFDLCFIISAQWIYHICPVGVGHMWPQIVPISRSIGRIWQKGD